MIKQKNDKIINRIGENKMSNLTIEQLRANFQTPELPKFTNNYYTFWDMDVGASATIRFLPDANTSNSRGFVLEKKQHKLTVNGQERKVPCLDMYGEKCPICQLSRDYYKNKDEVNGKKYYRTVQYIAQALIVDNPLPVKDGEEDPKGKVRLIAMGKQIYKIIKDTFESGELDEVPYDYAKGTDFVIKKDKQGDYPSYSLSKFSRKERALDPETIETLELVDLQTVLPRNPGADKVRAMLEADMTGEAYNDHADGGDVDHDPEAKIVTKKTAPAVAVASDNADSGSDLLNDLKAQLAARRTQG